MGGEWGTVCDDFWDNTDASVACYQLGFSRNSEFLIHYICCTHVYTVIPMSIFGLLYCTYYFSDAVGMTFGIPGTGLIHMDDVRCTGLESTLFSCLHTTSHNHDCAHSEDAGVTCQQRMYHNMTETFLFDV